MTRKRMIRSLWLLPVGGVLLILALGLATAGLIAANPRAAATAFASHALGRPVAFGQVAVAVWPGLRIQLDDTRVANAPWAATPDMLTVRRLTAEPALWPLLAGRLQFRRLVLDGATLRLERDGQGVGNWQRGGARPAAPPAPLVAAAHSREGFPAILALALHDSRILFRTTDGAELTMALDNVTLQTGDERQPVRIEASGSYNAVPVQVQIETQSFAALRDTRQPFAATIKATGATVALAADLQMMDPLNFDQFTGTLQLDAKNIGTAARFFGGSFAWPVPLRIAGGFARQGNRWDFSAAQGALAADRFAASEIHLTEGGRHEPDQLRMTLAFATLAIDPLARASGGSPLPEREPIGLLQPDAQPATLLDARLAAARLTYRGVTAEQAKMHASITAGAMALDVIAMRLCGGALHGAVKTQATTAAGETKAEIVWTQADAGQALLALKVKQPILTGRFTVRFAAAARGNTLAALRQSGQGRLSLGLTDGRISRRLLRLAATDLRLLGDRSAPMIPLSCLYAAVDLSHGIGRLAPFQLVTANGSVLGGGSIDLPRNTLDLTFQADARTTSLLAFDVPIRVTGALTDPQIAPALSRKGVLDFNGTSPQACLTAAEEAK